ncbi:S8 family serine peptidase [Actinophytocola oryzae]|uniref:Subtilase family protein n=1 Tax=Actinophytocola oryzae TaxID=502181 RepID=A0A4R7VXV9_9PSEU|nr:S8 family serine peptidase [Actinophytocola oryzae]TDV54993.1 subtilase family protein [Actinophytocola oryzae]
MSTAIRVALVIAVLFVAAPATGASAAQCATPAGVYRDGVGWAQRLTDPARVWPLSDGTGQLLAVLGTGVDAANAQFASGQVVPGSDATDCDGRGTFAAGIVAARPNPATTFTGMAPGVRILGVRYTETTTNGGFEGPDPDALAAALSHAVTARATVALVVAPSLRSSPALEGAVRDALAAGLVIVSPAVADEPGMRSYPTSLPGVIGVGAHNRDGAPTSEESGDYLALAAPGSDLVSTAAGAAGGLGHRWGIGDPAYAAAYVAGAVVLVRAYRPGLSPKDVLDRLTATANRPPAGGHNPWLGWGVLDVPAAVSAELPAVRPGVTRPPTVVPAAGPVPPAARPRLPGVLGVLGLVAAVLVVVTASAVTRASGGARR